ncbi:hypothetical protein SMSP2_02690 [Limihaloglobus sulfuriphilus]|uniref:Uncharacterized protein n=1 Tax=Limihaloglobus sulfuriphilus TaxID=1851148 RepID=A0A1Q2MIW8_9BACT|nr:hypothetical protein [Limihaloglobus sulfuriphilus]AQQ72307.1 hypothetical protein SMSP2_02690 [Limihaloglobus sulfuriphilus]
MGTHFFMVCISILFISNLYGIDIVETFPIGPDNFTYDGEDIVVTGSGQLIISGTHNFNSIHVMSGGQITHYPGEEVDLIVAGDVVIDAGGLINVNGKGYINEQGPGAGTGDRTDSNGGGGGGAYGGNGGNPESPYAGGIAYGSITEPSDLGSGGGDGYAGIGGAGGGRIKIIAGGTFTNNGTISANGIDGKSHGYGASGGGAGGSIWLGAAAFTGNGLISANGGRGYEVSEQDSGGGGGGRIAIYYDSSTYAGSTTAYGGISHAYRGGGAGTIYTKKAADTYGTLLMDNNSNTNARSNIDTLTVFDLVVSNGAMPALAAPLTVNNATVETGGSISYPAGTYEIEMTVLGDLLIRTNGSINANPTVTVQGNITVEADGSITANGRGYINEQGPGAGTGTRTDTNGGGGGGAYGGNGGKPESIYAGGIAYGSITEPVDLGSGGGDGYAGVGGAGGGRIRVIASGTFTNNGTISANGVDGRSHGYGASGGGSGGSIWIDAGSFAGSGLISSNGGRSYEVSEEDGGGGGGGRIAVYYDSSTYTGSAAAYGGISHASRCGGAGTVYMKNNSDTYGTVSMDNNANTNTRSYIDTESEFDLHVANGAMPAIVGLLTANDVTVDAGGIITHTAESKDINIDMHGDMLVKTGGLIHANATITIAGGTVVEPDGNISANGKGYINQQGPGAGTGTRNETNGGGGGGAYGGNGGNPESPYAGGIGYGSVLEPAELGSGGGDGYAGIGGYGGGKLRISVGGKFTNDGTVSANGIDGRAHSYGSSGGGSGGSIWIDAGSFAGEGLVSANGGIGHLVSEEDSGSGGGGRIAVYYDSSTYAGEFQAFGGTGSTGRIGGAGTIATGFKGETKLVTVANNNLAEGLTHFDTTEQFSLLVKDGGKPAPISLLKLYDTTVAAGGILTHPADTTYLKVESYGDLVVEDQGVISASADIAAMNIAVEPGGVVSSDGKGYKNGQGPGAGTGTRNDGYGGGGGGGYGNYGGNPQSPYSGGSPYGNPYSPIEMGSGGGDGYAGIGGYGGGALRLQAAQSLNNDGLISSNGFNGRSHSYGASGGGSGGSILVTAGSVSGEGLITANGGNGYVVSEEDSGGGSGGRIAVLSSSDITLSEENIYALGGSGYQSGGVGTVYLNETGGELFVLDNVTPTGTIDGYVSYIDIEFSTAVDESTFDIDDITLTGPGGVLTVSAIERIDNPLYSNIYRVSFPMQTAEGVYTIEVGPYIASAHGGTLDQDHNGTYGEVTDVFYHEFSAEYTFWKPQLLGMAAAWLEVKEGNENFPQEYDLVNDDTINILDFAEFYKLWPGNNIH